MASGEPDYKLRHKKRELLPNTRLNTKEEIEATNKLLDQECIAESFMRFRTPFCVKILKAMFKFIFTSLGLRLVQITYLNHDFP